LRFDAPLLCFSFSSMANWVVSSLIHVTQPVWYFYCDPESVRAQTLEDSPSGPSYSITSPYCMFI
jgi:hypothetical protein